VLCDSGQSPCYRKAVDALEIQIKRFNGVEIA
jgi:hypothetical protein